MIKRILTLSLAFNVFWMAAISPSYAFAPVPMLAAYGVTVAGSTVNVGASAASTLVGVTIAALALGVSDNADAPTTHIPMTSTNSAAVMPADPVAPAIMPKNPNSTTLYNAGNGIYLPTYKGACSAMFSYQLSIQTPPSGYSYGLESGDSTCYLTTIYETTGAVTSKTPMNPGVAGVYCNQGYSESAGQCNLVSAKAAVPDKKISVGRTGNIFAPTVDADSSPMPFTTSTSNGTWRDQVAATGRDSQGNLQRIHVKANVDGGSTMTISTQKADATGSTYLETKVMNVAPDGTVINASQTTEAKKLTVEQATGIATPIASPTSSYVPQASFPSDYARTGEVANIKFPTDYARSGEAANAATPIVNKLDTLHNDLTAQSEASLDPTLPPVTQFEDGFFKDTFTDLKGWRLPSHNGTCPTFAFDLSAASLGNHVMDTHCMLGDQIRSQLSDIMVVVWTLLAMFIVLGA